VLAPLRPSRLDRLLQPLHRWVWSDPRRRARKLLRFAATEEDGGRDLALACERTRDGVLRRLLLRHALDEQRHAALFRARGRALLDSLPRAGGKVFEANWLSPGERGLDDLRVEDEPDAALLAFLHLSEQAAARRFALYCQVLDPDPETRDLFAVILHDEAFHMSYTHAQLARLQPRRAGLVLWRARAARLWRAWLRLSLGLASALGALLLLAQYFTLLPPFALLARRAARREPPGFAPCRQRVDLTSQY
jgi:hypothetical protein